MAPRGQNLSFELALHTAVTKTKTVMGLTGCAYLKKEMKEKHSSALPNSNPAARPDIRVDIVAADMELCFFMAMMSVQSLVDMHNVGVQMLDFFTKKYLPRELVFMYESHGVPRVKSIEQERRDLRHAGPQAADTVKVSGTEFLEMIARLSDGRSGRPPMGVCKEIVKGLVLLRGSDIRVSSTDAKMLVSGDAIHDDQEFAARLFAYIAENMTFTRAELTQIVVSILSDRLDLFSYRSDAELAALADLLCPENAHLGTGEVLRKMFEKILGTRSMRAKVRFFVASRILHATTDVKVNSICMIGAPYVRYIPDDSDFSFGLMQTNLDKYRASAVATVESGKPWNDGDLCERTVVYKSGTPELFAQRVSPDMPGEGEAKSVVVAQRNPGKSIVVMSRDSDTLIILLLGISQNDVSTNRDPARAFGTLYADMGSTSPIDPVSYLVNVSDLHRDIVARASLDPAASEFPVETFCLRHLLSGCDYFSSPYALGPGAFSEGFHTLAPMMRPVIQRVRDQGASPHLPWVQINEELLWDFVRILYAADLSMAARVKQAPGFATKNVARLAARTQRGLGVLARLEAGGERLAASLLEGLPSHAEVVRESEEHAMASRVRKHRRAGDPEPVMQHDIELKAFWTEPQIRAYVRRVYWTINYFNGASCNQRFDPLATHDGRSIWGWAVDPESKKVLLDDDIINPSAFSKIAGTPALALL